MNDSFSGIVRISNISDFIAPSQACILPLRTNDHKETNNSLVNIRNRTDKTKIPTNGIQKKVTVSLNDCLACNGCITTAETILVQEQSTSKLVEGLSKASIGVITISPQSVCSIAVKRGWSTRETAKRLACAFKRLGATYILDSSFGRYLTLSLSYEEFKRKHKSGVVFCSVCPGFVCYAEKTHGKLLAPYMSRIRSPQAMMGSLVKDYLSRTLSTDGTEIFHATVMPCFDKKLEASRTEFGTDCRQVDCVISTAEANELLDRNDEYSEDSSGSSSNIDWLTAFEHGVLIGQPGGASGGYAEYIIKRYMEESEAKELSVRRIMKVKNVETIEVVDGDAVLLRVAKCYGFRNIQNLVQKIKRGKCDYDYVEVMACPSGCANGGGQLRGETTEERTAIVQSVIEAYDQLSPNKTLESILKEVKAQWEELNERWRDLLLMEFHVIDKNIAQSTNLRW